MIRVVFLFTALLAFSTATKAADLDTLEKKVDILTEEIERLKLGSEIEPADLSGEFGFAPAAAKVYKKGAKKVSIGGYGEMVYKNYQPKNQNGAGAGKRDRLDFLRAILYVGYKFNDWITFNSEIEFEHATEGKRGEVGVEMAQIDFTPWGDTLGFRVGLLLTPMGLVNEVHEPTTFHGVERPGTESSVLPSTWRENGAGLFGRYKWFEYRSYVTNGLQAVTDGGASPAVSGFSASSGLRNGRQKGSNTYAEDFAWVSRLDVSPIDDVVAGFSLYTGEADQNALSAPSIPLTFWDLHAKAQYKGAELRVLYTEGKIGNVDELNILQGKALGSNASIGSKLFGGYIEAAYDVGRFIPASEKQYLAPFFRYERYDTQKEVPDGWTKNPSNSRTEYTLGLTYKPTAQVALKLDHMFKRNQGGTGVGQTNMGVGYIF